MKLQVGDIEMDSAGGTIRIGDASANPGEAPPVRARDEQKPQCDVTAVIRRLPQWSARTYRWLAWSFGICAVLVAIAGVGGSTGGSISPLFAILPGLIAAAVGSVLVAARIDRGPEPSRIDQERATRLAAVLSSSEVPLTVEQIQAATGWLEGAVVMGLHLLTTSGRVEEDLDLDTGHWCYRLVGSPEGAELRPVASLPISDRAADIEKRRGSVNRREP